MKIKITVGKLDADAIEELIEFAGLEESDSHNIHQLALNLMSDAAQICGLKFVELVENGSTWKGKCQEIKDARFLLRDWATMTILEG